MIVNKERCAVCEYFIWMYYRSDSKSLSVISAETDDLNEYITICAKTR